MTVLEEFATWAVGRRGAALSAPVAHATIRSIVDWYAAVVAGASAEPARILTAALVDDDEVGHSRLLPGGRGVRPRTAALINGTAAHTAEVDDIYRDGIFHPGAPTIAAALALAEHRDASGDELLRAVLVGYEVGNRIAAAVNPAHYRFWHTTGTIGALSAAAAAAELLELDAPRFSDALATATTMAAGLQQAFRSDAMSKPLHSGHAAEAGLLAAMAAAHGFSGAADVLEGEAGFGPAMAASPDWSRALAGLGTDEPTITAMTVKNHSCCGHAFAALDAGVLLGLTVDPDAVERIEVETYRVAIEVAGNPDPKTEFEAKFSIPFTLAWALCHGPVRLRAFAEEQRNDPRVRALAAKVTLRVDPRLDAAFPGQRGARVTVIGTDGRRHTEQRPTRKGDPDDPLTDTELADKFIELVTPALGAAATTATEAMLWALANLDSVRSLGARP